MKKKILMILLLFLLCGCSYFQVKNAIKEADEGNYVASLRKLLSVLKENNEDRRALDAFEIIYPEAERSYNDELDKTRNRDIIGYTKALLKLLRVEQFYYDLPELSKNSIAVIKPPEEERKRIKKELAQSFFTIGNGTKPVTYEDKLRVYGYYSQAKYYDLEQREDIDKKYRASEKNAIGNFLVKFSGNQKGLIESLKTALYENIGSYPLFHLGNAQNYNLKYDVTVSNLKYTPPKLTTYSGVDSYIDRVLKRAIEKVVETRIVNGKPVQVERWVPVEKWVEVRIYYRYIKYIKTTSMSYDLRYSLAEKNGTVISNEEKTIGYEDRATWVEYYPLNPFVGARPFNFPVSEPEQYVMGREELYNTVLNLGDKELNRVLNNLDSNRIIDW